MYGGETVSAARRVETVHIVIVSTVLKKFSEVGEAKRRAVEII